MACRFFTERNDTVFFLNFNRSAPSARTRHSRRPHDTSCTVSPPSHRGQTAIYPSGFPSSALVSGGRGGTANEAAPPGRSPRSRLRLVRANAHRRTRSSPGFPEGLCRFAARFGRPFSRTNDQPPGHNACPSPTAVPPNGSPAYRVPGRATHVCPGRRRRHTTKTDYIVVSKRRPAVILPSTNSLIALSTASLS